MAGAAAREEKGAATYGAPKTKVCWNWLVDPQSCEAGRECKFAHYALVCEDWWMGRECRFGEYCTRLHRQPVTWRVPQRWLKEKLAQEKKVGYADAIVIVRKRGFEHDDIACADATKHKSYRTYTQFIQLPQKRRIQIPKNNGSYRDAVTGLIMVKEDPAWSNPNCDWCGEEEMTYQLI
jgi:hypothetical protein